MDGDRGPFFCPESAMLEGLLRYHSVIGKHVDVRRVKFTKPRTELVSLLGEDLQSCPVLVFGEEGPDAPAAATRGPRRNSFIAGAKAISEYLAATFALSRPHP